MRPRHWLRWLVGAIVVLVVLGVGGPFVYIHFFNGSTPAALSLPTASSSAPGGTAPGGTATASSAAAGSLAGTYSVGSGSVVGYRVNEVLLGQSTTAVGRTTSVTGHLTIAGTTATAATATAATFSVPMATVHSDKSQRDAQFDGRIMDVAQYPTGTFTLTSPIDLAPLPATGVIKSYTATGKLTLHGATRTVTFTLTAERSTAKDGGAQIEVVGHIPVLFSDYNVQNPSVGGFVTTQDDGLLEFLLIFSKA
jgi:polyisoprenoid-binding protein YceI